MAAAKQKWGTTPPLSEAAPSTNDLKLDDALTQELKAQGVFAPQSDTDKREAILAKLRKLLQQMVQDVGRKKGLPQAILDTAGGEIRPYGSYKLGVHEPSSDIDTLMVAPKHCTRDDFFEYMPDLLKNSSQPGEIDKLVAIPGAATPLIKLKIQGVEIDLIFCSIQVQSITDKFNITDNDVLRGLSETDLRCVNGARVASRILEVIPQSKMFRKALRAIKLWATRRAIYGNTFGYPGGVAYAILVARICQLYPRAATSVIVSKFFFILVRWQWPKPVFLQEKEANNLLFREWDPLKSKGDAAHYMPMLTPTYPSSNTTHTIGPSTKAVIMKELVRGEVISREIYAGKRPWKDLFVKHTIFTETYKHYISVVTAAKSETAHNAWSGLVESKIRHLVAGIEHSDAQSVELVQPFNKGIHRVHVCKDEAAMEATLEGGMDSLVSKKDVETASTDLAAEVKIAEAEAGAAEEVAAVASDAFPQKVWTTTYYLGIALKKGQSLIKRRERVFSSRYLLTCCQFQAQITSTYPRLSRTSARSAPLGPTTTMPYIPSASSISASECYDTFIIS